MEKIEIDVSKYDIRDGQTVIVKTPVGPWGVIEIQDHCKAIMDAFKDEFKRNKFENVNFFIFPTSPLSVSPSLEVFDPPKPGSTIVMNVPIGGMQSGDAIKYLKSIRDMTLLDWDKKYPGVHLQVFGITKDGRQVELKIKQ